MTWTTEKPTMAGHYWWVFDDATPTVIKLDDCGEWFKPGCAGRFIPPSRSQFAGPIECPPILLEPLP